MVALTPVGNCQYLTPVVMLGRECPQLPAEVLFSDIEIKVLSAHAKKKT